MSKAYVPKINPTEDHLHIKVLINKVAHMLKTGQVKLAHVPKAKFPKVHFTKTAKLKG